MRDQSRQRWNCVVHKIGVFVNRCSFVMTSVVNYNDGQSGRRKVLFRGCVSSTDLHIRTCASAAVCIRGAKRVFTHVLLRFVDSGEDHRGVFVGSYDIS